MKRKFSEELLDEVMWLDKGKPETFDDGIEYTVIESRFLGKGRWTDSWEMVFKIRENNQESYWMVDYRTPATECQDCDKFDADIDGMVECVEVVPVEKTVVVYIEKAD